MSTRWIVQSGSLYTSILACSAEEAVLQAIENEAPEELGEVLSALEEGKDEVFAIFFHTESFLRARNLWAEDSVNLVQSPA